VNPLLETALAALADLRDDLRRNSNKAFFGSRYVSAVDFGKQEATVRNAIELLALLHPHHVSTLSTDEPEHLAG